MVRSVKEDKSSIPTRWIVSVVPKPLTAAKIRFQSGCVNLMVEIGHFPS
jgi:hypothetical protein